MKIFGAVMPATLLLLLIFANFSSAAAQGDSIYKLPTGTKMSLKLDAEINSRVSSVNDTFVAVLTKAVVIRETTVLAKGTMVEGRIANVERAAIGGKAGRIEVSFEWLRLAHDQRRRIDGRMLTAISGKSSRRFLAFSILGGAIAGTAIGASSKSAANTAIGGGIGLGAGAAIGFARRGHEARLAKNEEFEIELKSEVVLPVLDY